MDTKALAKSKRAHSLHNKKKYQSHQAFKAPSTGSDDKKPTGKQSKERPSQSHVQQANERPLKSHGARPLPSNWDRYDEDFNLDSEEAEMSSSQRTEFALPKSKGADYAHLISEAKAQSQEHYSPDVVPLFDDFINDFTQDFGPMLAAKGKSFLSWIADDSFEFEDKTNTSIEAPFLSLNLNALAEQLAKAKLSDRLYLKPDLLPLELVDDELQACGNGKHGTETCTSEAGKNPGASYLGYNEEIRKNGLQHEPASSTITLRGDIPAQISEEALKSVRPNKGEIPQLQGTDRSISSRSVSKRITDSHSTSGKPPIFEAASAEAELDVLLSSFGEANVLSSWSASTTGFASTTTAASGETVKKGTHMAEPSVIRANIDDDIDNLLEETSNLTVIDDKRLSPGLRTSTDTISTTVHPSSTSKVLDDFDSWLDTI